MNRTKVNVTSQLFSQFTYMVCGLIVPRIMISTYGSSMYGLTTSIAQFLNYASLLEGGVAGVARAELYTPLARKDNYEISRVYHAVKHFFLWVGIVFIVYTLFLSVGYYDISEVSEVGRGYTFCLIWIISAATIVKYVAGISNLTLLDADKKQYVRNIVFTIATVINAIIVVLLSKSGCDLLVVKMFSSIVYIAQPICYSIYVRIHYELPFVGKNRSELKQKWTGIGQHIAYFLHTNTDVVILTIFADLRDVAVYTVYRAVISNIRQVVASFTSGMEATFGEYIAKKELHQLQASFFKYKHMLSFMSSVLFGATAILIVPFIRLYTSGVTDANYIQPLFALVLLFTEAIDGFIHPCCSLPISANQLKESRWGSYGEAGINIVLSLILVHWNPLVGVALATLIATIFKSVFYIVYSSRYILHIRLGKLLKSYLFTIGLIGIFAILGVIVLSKAQINSYFQWILWGVIECAITFAVTTGAYLLAYPGELKNVFRLLLQKIRKKE